MGETGLVKTPDVRNLSRVGLRPWSCLSIDGKVKQLFKEEILCVSLGKSHKSKNRIESVR